MLTEEETEAEAEAEEPEFDVMHDPAAAPAGFTV